MGRPHFPSLSFPGEAPGRELQGAEGAMTSLGTKESEPQRAVLSSWAVLSLVGGWVCGPPGRFCHRAPWTVTRTPHVRTRGFSPHGCSVCPCVWPGPPNHAAHLPSSAFRRPPFQRSQCLYFLRPRGSDSGPTAERQACLSLGVCRMSTQVET